MPGESFYPKYLSVCRFLATVDIKSSNPDKVSDMLVLSELQYLGITCAMVLTGVLEISLSLKMRRSSAALLRLSV